MVISTSLNKVWVTNVNVTNPNNIKVT